MLTSALVIAHVVVMEGSIRRAARRLDLAPQTLSEAVRRFEEETALPLLDRGPGGATIPLSAIAADETLSSIFRLLMEVALLCGGGTDAAGQESWAGKTGLTLAALQRLLLIARAGSIRRVAGSLGLSQPQLSRQMAHLEEKLGVKLLARSLRGVEVTAAGQVLLPLFDQIVSQAQSLRQAGDLRFHRISRAVRVGSILQTSPDSWIARAMGLLVSDWVRAHPDRPISVRAMPADTLREALRTRRLDVVLIDTAEGLEEFSVRQAMASDLVAIAPLYSTSTTMADLVLHHPLCLTSRRTGLALAFDRLGTELPNGGALMPMVEVESLPVLVDLVASHGFVSLLARPSAEAMRDRVRIVEIGREIPCAFYVVHGGGTLAADVADRLVRQLQITSGGTAGALGQQAAQSDVKIGMV